MTRVVMVMPRVSVEGATETVLLLTRPEYLNE